MSRTSGEASLPQGDDGGIVRRRRGRQPRPCTLSSTVRSAAFRFAEKVGSPRVIEPAGFRDFVGWLQHLNSPDTDDEWARLAITVLVDCECDREILASIQPDIVREIIARVITPRNGESNKLVSTNARRQSTRPEQGMTLMKIFDKVLSSNEINRCAQEILRNKPKSSLSRHSSSLKGSSSSMGTVKLPSMRELDESLRRR